MTGMQIDPKRFEQFLGDVARLADELAAANAEMARLRAELKAAKETIGKAVGQAGIGKLLGGILGGR